jgi:beta-fructofuranosidase
MNDPNGLIQWQGAYHLFYQYNPTGPAWGNIHWGHTVSHDLVHWTHLPIALAPTPGTADEHGCWSGYVVNDNGTATLIYTGFRDGIQLPCLATSRDGSLVTWEKYEGNPLLAGPPDGLEVLGFRDHCLWQEDGVWYQLIGSGVPDAGGLALLYRSTDLRRWEYVHPLCSGNGRESGEMWECPDFFSLADRHVLLISPVPLRKSLYLTGCYREHKLFVATEGVIDGGGYFYAPQTLLDEKGRRLMWGWLWEGRSEQAACAAGWAGVMSLPRVLSLHTAGYLLQTPAPELASLRGRRRQFGDIDLTGGDVYLLPGVSGDRLEIIAEFEPAGGGIFGDEHVFGLKIRRSPDGGEETLIRYEGGQRHLVIDRERASLDGESQRDLHGGKLPPEEVERLRLHVFLDCSVVEVFGNGRVCVSTRIYPSRSDSLGIGVFAGHGRVRLKSLDVWTMGSID